MLNNYTQEEITAWIKQAKKIIKNISQQQRAQCPLTKYFKRKYVNNNNTNRDEENINLISDGKRSKPSPLQQHPIITSTKLTNKTQNTPQAHTEKKILNHQSKNKSKVKKIKEDIFFHRIRPHSKRKTISSSRKSHTIKTDNHHNKVPSTPRNIKKSDQNRRITHNKSYINAMTPSSSSQSVELPQITTPQIKTFQNNTGQRKDNNTSSKCKTKPIESGAATQETRKRKKLEDYDEIKTNMTTEYGDASKETSTKTVQICHIQPISTATRQPPTTVSTPPIEKTHEKSKENSERKNMIDKTTPTPTNTKPQDANIPIRNRLIIQRKSIESTKKSQKKRKNYHSVQNSIISRQTQNPDQKTFHNIELPNAQAMIPTNPSINVASSKETTLQTQKKDLSC